MPRVAKRLLIVDDDEDILTAGELLLKRRFGEVVTCRRPEGIPGLLAGPPFDAILLDMNFSPGASGGRQGIAWLKRILEMDPDAVVVMITAHGGVELAVEAMKHGAADFICKPWENEKVIATLSAAVRLHDSQVEARRLKRGNQALVEASGKVGHVLLGRSKAMEAMRSLIRRAAPTDANVLILGENGTGKELVAREVHHRSRRGEQVFMSVDLGAVSESLFESELFGHLKGAFTGAAKDRVGRLVAADGGTLFLDEIGNIPKRLQAKLLTVLEQRKVTPLGANCAIPIDVRVIAATNISRADLGDEKIFRQDLLFRLNTVEIPVPPLRRRVEDIGEIMDHYAGLYSRKYHKAAKPFSERALEAARAYSWPGNVRSLRHAVERAVILSEGDRFEPEDLQLGPNAWDEERRAAEADRDEAATRGAGEPEDLHLERMGRRLTELALKKHGYNISKAAKELGLTRATLYRRIEKYGF